MNDAVVVTLVVPTAAATRKKKLLVIMIRESEFMGRMGEIVGTGRGRIEASTSKNVHDFFLAFEEVRCHVRVVKGVRNVGRKGSKR